jgi:hypothetical protein
MFSSKIPFYGDAAEMRVVFGVMQGKRPARPLDKSSRARGLNDDVWALIETCWTQEPTHRPNASWIVERLRTLGSQRVDQRPFDDSSLSLPSLTLSDPKHPFAALVANTEIPHISQFLPRLSGGPLDYRGKEIPKLSFVPTAAVVHRQPVQGSVAETSLLVCMFVSTEIAKHSMVNC